MNLLIIRHAKAEDGSGEASRHDAGRRLTDEGRKEMRKSARGLREIAPAIDILATSPLTRARETAAIVAEVLHLPDIVELPLLAPDGDKEALLAWLGAQPAASTVAVVGHEPSLSALVSRLISGNQRCAITLKTGACCLIEFEDVPAPGRGTLLWLLQPRQLRKIED